MNRLSKHDVNRLSVAKLKELLPFELVADGEAIALVCDVNSVLESPKARHDVNKGELPLSKHRQAASQW